jgi:hypothetical protein
VGEPARAPPARAPPRAGTSPASPRKRSATRSRCACSRPCDRGRNTRSMRARAKSGASS